MFYIGPRRWQKYRKTLKIGLSWIQVQQSKTLYSSEDAMHPIAKTLN